MCKKTDDQDSRSISTKRLTQSSAKLFHQQRQKSLTLSKCRSFLPGSGRQLTESRKNIIMTSETTKHPLLAAILNRTKLSTSRMSSKSWWRFEDDVLYRWGWGGEFSVKGNFKMAECFVFSPSWTGLVYSMAAQALH